MINLNVPDEAWKAVGDAFDDDTPECGDERAHLLATISINDGVMMHLEAWEVMPDVDPQAVRQLSDDTFGDLGNGFGSDGPFDTLTISGREYVVFASPYC